MNKVLLGLLLGALLGAIDGATAWFTPAVRAKPIRKQRFSKSQNQQALPAMPRNFLW